MVFRSKREFDLYFCFYFYFCFIVSQKVFEKTDLLSRKLKNMQVSPGEAISMTSVTPLDIDKMRNDDYFETLWSDSLKLAATIEAEKTRGPRVRKP